MPREHKRFPVSLGVVLDFLSGEPEARISDISVEGCFVDTIVIVPKGENITFRVHLPTGQWMQLCGEVTYCLPHSGFGIRFTNLSEEKQIILLQQIILATGGKPIGRTDNG